MTHLGTKVIKTPRLTLRPFRMEDREAMFRNWQSDPKVTEFLRWPTAKSIADAQRVLEEWTASYQNPSYYQWAIVLEELGEPIGSISVVEQDEATDKVHIGYCIGSRWWHMGITSEAFSAIISFLFEEVGANRIESQHDPNNPNSGKVIYSPARRAGEYTQFSAIVCRSNIKVFEDSKGAFFKKPLWAGHGAAAPYIR